MKLGKRISVKNLSITSEVALLMTHDINKRKKCFLKVNNIRGFANRIAQIIKQANLHEMCKIVDSCAVKLSEVHTILNVQHPQPI
jgi:hypothetical protein